MRILTWVICPFILLLRFSIPAKEKNHVFNKKDEPSWMDTTSEKGRKVFNASCSSCHKDSGLSAGPAKTILGAMTPRAVYAALMNGKMKIQAASLTESEKKAVAQWVTGGKLVETCRIMHLLIFYCQQAAHPFPSTLDGEEISKDPGFGMFSKLELPLPIFPH
jgi:hypothetical protein